MGRQHEIEIYIRGCSISQLLAWIETVVGAVSPPQEAGAAMVYATRVGPLIITPSVEGGPFMSVWFNTPASPWATDLDCARDAARTLGCTVRCDPGSLFPVVPSRAPAFLEVIGTTERLISW